MFKARILNIIFIVLLSIFFGFTGCKEHTSRPIIQTGADQMLEYIPLLHSKNIAIVANQTSIVNNKHLVDTLLSLNVTLKKIFGPEHGFRGTGDAGEKIQNSNDKKTGLPIISLHGKSKKPLPEDLADIDLMIFDIQDVGVRFYTYISTLQYVMQACAENNVDLLVLDRPNPNGFYIDGPVLDTAFRSFLGLNPIPLVYGMTIGEMAQMINGEGWLKNNMKCKLQVILCKNYDHNSHYTLPVNPSPNLQTMRAIYLYPSLGLFEGTVISAGRGTSHPFECYGHPELKNTNYSFTPLSIPGKSKYPKFENKLCHGFLLDNKDEVSIINNKQINLNWLLSAYKEFYNQDITFFNPYFTHHAGTKLLQKQIENGLSADAIRKSWKSDIEKFKKIRKKYLLYKDFE